MTPAKIPTMQELISPSENDLKDNGLMVILNQAPHTSWVKDHPFLRGHKYIPIGRVEYLLRRIFTKYRIEVLKTGMLLNTVEVTVRVHYQDPVSKEMNYHDGVGAQELQTQKDSGPLKLDMSNINKGAVTMALPIAKSLAIKDACDHIGKIFGSDLNRKDDIDYNSLLKTSPEDQLEELKDLFDKHKDKFPTEESNRMYEIIVNREITSYTKAVKTLKSKEA